MDPKSNAILSNLHPDVSMRYLKGVDAMLKLTGLEVRPTEGFRTFATQMEYFAKGREKQQNGSWMVVEPKKVITWALPGLSMHHYGLAADSCFVGKDPFLEKIPVKDADALWLQFGECMERQGLKWGGRNTPKKLDRPHVELSFGLTLRQIQDLHEKGGVIAVWTKVDKIIQCGGELV